MLVDAAGTDLVLVGDSLGMVIQGHDTTVPVTVDDVIYNWNNRGSKAIEVFAAELAQFDMLQIVTSKKANTNSKGEAFRGLKHFYGGGAREKGSTVRETRGTRE